MTKQGVVEIKTFSKTDIFFLDIFTRQCYENILNIIQWQVAVGHPSHSILLLKPVVENMEYFENR